MDPQSAKAKARNFLDRKIEEKKGERAGKSQRDYGHSRQAEAHQRRDERHAGPPPGGDERKGRAEAYADHKVGAAKAKMKGGRPPGGPGGAPPPPPPRPEG